MFYDTFIQFVTANLVKVNKKCNIRRWQMLHFLWYGEVENNAGQLFGFCFDFRSDELVALAMDVDDFD